MKKTVLSLAVASLVLTGCSSKKDELSKKTVDGKDVIASVGSENIYADSVNDIVVDTTTGNESIYNQVSKLLIKTAYPVTSDIKASAEVKVEQFKTTAKETASSNGTEYEDELKTAMEGLGVSSLKELKAYYQDELQKSKLSDNYWKEKESDYYSAYVSEGLPYHLSHILVSVGTTDMFFLDTISEEYAKKIGNVIKDLKSARTFDFVAQNYSDDSSADKGGDLGLMDVNTAFVSEFKYSVYMLDYYIQLTKNANFFASTSQIYQDTVNELKESAYYENGLNTIPMSAASLLLSAADKTTYNVNNYSYTRTYTRNILFNEYFNHPGASVIVFDDESQLIENTVDGEGNVTAYGNYVELKTSDSATPVKVLASGGKVVMAVRSTTLDSSSGIHFITIDQSPLADNANTYFSNDTEKDDDGNYVNNTYISFYGEDEEKNSKDKLKTAVKNFIEGSASEENSDTILNAEMFEYYYDLNKDKLTLAEGIDEMFTSYIASLKNEHNTAFLTSFNETLAKYVKSLNTFESFRSDAHYIPVGCIDENGDAVNVTINGSSVKACIRQDGRWVVRDNQYTIKTTVTTGVSVADNEVEVNQGQSGNVVLTVEDGYTLTGETSKTALKLEIDNTEYTIGTTEITGVTVVVDGQTITITFTGVTENRTVKVSPAA